MADNDDGGCLTSGIPDAIVNGKPNKVGYAQVIEVEAPEKDSNCKVWIWISDGEKKCRVVVPIDYYDLFCQGEEDGGITQGSILQIGGYACKVHPEHGPTAALTDFTVAQTNCDDLSTGELQIAQKAGSAPRGNFGRQTQPKKSNNSNNNKKQSNNNNSNQNNPDQNKQSRNQKYGMKNSGASKSKNQNNNKRKRKSKKDAFVPISSLSPYSSNNWRIKVRITEKDANMRTWNKPTSQGKLFNFTVMDKEGVEITVTAFNDEADKLYNMVEKDKIYIISKGRVKSTNPKFRKRVQHEYCINSTRDTLVELCDDQTFEATRKYNIVDIKDLQNAEENSYVDVMGVVKEVDEIQEFQSRAGKDCRKRTICVVDRSNSTIDITFWFELADKYTKENLPVGSVCIFPGCRVGNYGGVSLSGSEITMDPDHPDKDAIAEWWKNGGSGAQTVSLTSRFSSGGPAERLSWAEAKQADKGLNKEGSMEFKGDWFAVRGFITHFGASAEKFPGYMTVPQTALDAGVSAFKVSDDGNGRYSCAKNGETYDDFTWRFILRFALSDWSDGQYCSSFHEVAKQILDVEP
eukprot:UN24835